MRNNHEYRKNFLSQSVVEEWNNLPDGVKEARAVQIFKHRYRRHADDTGARLREQGDANKMKKNATEPGHPHQGPTWTTEDHLTSIPSM